MPVPNQALPGGYQLLNYRIDRQISRGGFSIVYRAFDETGAPVAIKEYLPSSLVLRTEGDIVRATSAENLTSFRYGMKCFFEEGRALANINHPNVVRVLNFFRANETVYMVMRYERGRTLQQQIQMRQDQMSERFVRHVFMHLLNGLREVHTHKLLHLDIKPANIYLRTDGSPVLLDFGAARQTLTSNRPKLAPMYTPGFAAPEQYRDPDRLGPWTDVYGTGASMFAFFKSGGSSLVSISPINPATRANPTSPTCRIICDIGMPAVLASVVLTTLPIVILYAIGRRQLLSGLTAGFGK